MQKIKKFIGFLLITSFVLSFVSTPNLAFATQNNQNNSKATIIAKKIVCDSESDLPNWGNDTGPEKINNKTAQDFLKDHPNCKLVEGWDFQWSISDVNSNDNTPDLGEDWTNFGPTNPSGQTVALVPKNERIWVREVVQDGYIPFSGAIFTKDTPDEDNDQARNSAEIYCDTDIYNYDNFDYVDTNQTESSYYCIAFNAKIPQQNDPLQVHIYKHLKEGDITTQIPDDANIAPFQMIANWAVGGEGENFNSSGPYTLGEQFNNAPFKYSASSYETTELYDFSTTEVTGGDTNVVGQNDQCVPGKYKLIGYKSGNTLEEAQNAEISTEAPVYIDLTSDRHIIVVNEECPEVEIPQTSTVKICKLDDAQNPLANWSVMLEGESVQSDLVIPTNISSGVNSNPLVSGVSYIAKSVGTWLNQGGANKVDTEYSTTDNWATQMDGYTGYQSDILELQVNNEFDPNSNWGAYNSLHKYVKSFTQSSNGPANFRIFDGSGTVQNEGWFADNSGSLTVDINKGYAGITQENGCVIFNEVPYGNYKVDEIMQDGWENVSGLNSVTVDNEEETFTIVNQEIDTTIPEEPKESGRVRVSKFIDGVKATSLMTASIHFPIYSVTEALWFNLDNDGHREGDVPYQASTLVLPGGSVYELREELATATVGSMCGELKPFHTDQYKPYALVGYSVGKTYEEAVSATITPTINPIVVDGDVHVIVHNTKCETPTTEPEPTYLKVHVFKYLKNGDSITQVSDTSDVPAFPMQAQWQTENLNGGSLSSGNYVLGDNHGGAAFKYSAYTSSMQAPADYTTFEITDGNNVLSTSAQCVPGKYKLVGYKSGDSILEAQNSGNISVTAPVFDDITSDKYVIVINELCANDTPEEPEEPEEPTDACPLMEGNQATTEECPVVEEPTDACPLIEGNQASVDECPEPEQPIDMCPSLEGNQATTEECPVVEEPTDMCPNLLNDQSTIPAGMELDEAGDCVPTESPEEPETPNEEPKTQCNDGIDNEGDGKIDMEDPGCEDENDNDETDPRRSSRGGGYKKPKTVVTSVTPKPEVLGATTQCGIYIDTFLRRGYNNDKEAVMKLQKFLNDFIKANLIVDGDFGPATEKALKKFQDLFASHVLNPWKLKNSTGIFYITTQHLVNTLMCPDLGLPTPELIPIEVNPKAPKKN